MGAVIATEEDVVASSVVVIVDVVVVVGCCGTTVTVKLTVADGGGGGCYDGTAVAVVALPISTIVVVGDKVRTGTVVRDVVVMVVW